MDDIEKNAAYSQPALLRVITDPCIIPPACRDGQDQCASHDASLDHIALPESVHIPAWPVS